MNEYIYTNHKTEEVIFIIKAKDILQADKTFKGVLGYDVSKHNYIGCKIKFNKGGD